MFFSSQKQLENVTYRMIVTTFSAYITLTFYVLRLLQFKNRNMACIKRFLRPYALAIHHHKFIYNPLAAIVPSNHFSNEIGKRYSHQDIKKIITPTTTVKKKRQVIRKKLTEDTVEKTGVIRNSWCNFEKSNLVKNTVFIVTIS